MADGAISIGRNVGAVPMEASRWREFISEMVGLVQAAGGKVFAVAHGRGHWEGSREDNAVITFGDADVVTIHEQLASYAILYEQDAIALLIGAGLLVGPYVKVATK